MTTHQGTGIFSNREQALYDLWRKMAQTSIAAFCHSTQRQDGGLAQSPIRLPQSNLRQNLTEIQAGRVSSTPIRNPSRDGTPPHIYNWQQNRKQLGRVASRECVEAAGA